MEIAVKGQREAKVQLLPFAVVPQDGAASQEARVSDLMLVSQREGRLSSSFRGRAIEGVRLALPEHYVGAVATVDERRGAKKRRVDSDDEQEADEEDDAFAVNNGPVPGRKGEIQATFREIILWEHDTAPLSSDNPFEWMEWPKFAKIINQPVKEEDLSKRTEKYKA